MRKLLMSTAILLMATFTYTNVSAQGTVHTDTRPLVNISKTLGAGQSGGYDIQSFTANTTEKNLFVAFYSQRKSFVYPIKQGLNTLPMELTNITQYGVYSATDAYDGTKLRNFNGTLTFNGVPAKAADYPYHEQNVVGLLKTDAVSDNVGPATKQLISNKTSVLDQVSFTTAGSQFIQSTTGMFFTNHVTDYDYISIKTDNGDKVELTFEEEVNIQELVLKGSKYLNFTFFDAQNRAVGKINPKDVLTPVNVKSAKKVIVTVQSLSEISRDKFYGNHVIRQIEFNGTKKDGSPLFVDKQVIHNTSGTYDAINSYSKVGEIAPSTVIAKERGTNGWLLIQTDRGDKWMKDGYNVDKILFTQQSGLYDTPHSVVRTHLINPQLVVVKERGTDGWIKIQTWLGDKWTKEGYTTNTHQIEKSSGLYNAPNTTARITFVSPQSVNVLERRTDGWMKIQTWIGEKWMKDGYTEAVEYVYLTSTFGMYKEAGGKGYVASANPARLRVLKKAANGWYYVPTYKGNLWVKNGYNQKSASVGTKTYRVVRGDTLYAVSRKTGTSVLRIKQLNGLRTNSIYIGQVLKVN